MRQQAQAPNGDTVYVDVPEPVTRAPASKAAKDRVNTIRAFRKEFYATHRKAPTGNEIAAVLRRR